MTYKDIRDRDINARAGYDPRYDKRVKQTAALSIPSPPSTPTTLNIPTQESRRMMMPEQPLAIYQPAAQQPQPPAVVQQPQPPAVVAQQPQPATPAALPSRQIVTGDSVATGIGHGGARGDASSEAAWGRGSNEQLVYMQAKGPEYYQGADVTLSSGVLNSGDLQSVEQQIRFLVNAGARTINLAGAPLTGQYSRFNPLLAALARKYGIRFMGGYQSSDGVHPSSYSTYR